MSYRVGCIKSFYCSRNMVSFWMCLFILQHSLVMAPNRLSVLAPFYLTVDKCLTPGNSLQTFLHFLLNSFLCSLLSLIFIRFSWQSHHGSWRVLYDPELNDLPISVREREREREQEEKGEWWRTEEREREKTRERERQKATYHLENDIGEDKASQDMPGLSALVLHVSMRTM